MVGFPTDLYSVTVHEVRNTHCSWRPIGFVGFKIDGNNSIVISVSSSMSLFFFVSHLIVAIIMLRSHSVNLNRDNASAIMLAILTLIECLYP